METFANLRSLAQVIVAHRTAAVAAGA